MRFSFVIFCGGTYNELKLKYGFTMSEFHREDDNIMTGIDQTTMVWSIFQSYLRFFSC